MALEHSWELDCGCDCKGPSCGGGSLRVYLGLGRSPAWGEIADPVVKVRTSQLEGHSGLRSGDRVLLGAGSEWTWPKGICP